MNRMEPMIRERGAAVLDAGVALRAATLEARVDWLAAASRRLADTAHQSSAALASSTGLSRAMVEWGTRTTLDTVRAPTLRALAKQALRDGFTPIPLLSVVLAGNLFTASVREILVPLLLGVPVLAKASTREDAFPRMLVEALRHVDATLGGAVDVVTFSGGDAAAERALFERAGAVAVYGSDATLAEIQSRHPNTPLIAHGHGVSAAYCGRAALEAAPIEGTAAAAALDVAAYDQRGCLSPQVIYVEETRACSAEAFAESLARGLETALPRGPLPLPAGAAQAQWRGLAEVEGRLILGDSYAISVRPAESIRWSPAYRNVNVSPVASPSEAAERMQAFAQHLKCVGVDSESRATLQAELRRHTGITAYTCTLGTMQTPPLDAPADGQPPWRGLLRL